MGLNKYQSMRKLWAIKSGLEPDDFEDNEATLYGKHMEPFAVKEYEWETGITGFQPCLFIHPEHSFVRASVDAFHFKHNYALEIKSPYNPKNIAHAAEGKIDRKYYAQLNWIMFASNTSMIKYCVYSGTKLWIKEVKADVEYQRRMFRYAKWFWHQVKTKKDPKRRKFKHLRIDHIDVTEGL